MKHDHTTHSQYLTYTLLFKKGWENVIFELGIERVDPTLTNPNPNVCWDIGKGEIYDNSYWRSILVMQCNFDINLKF